MRILTALVFVAAVASSPLPAQVPDSAIHVRELEVHVTRTPAALSSLGASASIVDSAALHRGRLATGLDEALAFVPGLVAQNRYNYSVDQRLSIRGFGARANFGLRGVKVLLDGVPQTLPDGQSQLNNLDLSLVNRAEVLRGGASALYGNASGGVVSFVTNAIPQQPWSFSARAEAGSFGTSKEEIVAAGRAGTLGGTVAASRFYTDGFRQQSAADQRRFSAAGDWAVSSSTSVMVRISAADDPRARNPGALTAIEYSTNRDSAAANNIRRGADKAVTQTQLAFGVRHDAEHFHLDATLFGLDRSLTNPLATPPPAPTNASEGTWVTIGRGLGGARVSATMEWARLSLTGGIDGQGLQDDRTNSRSVNGVRTDTLLLNQRERVGEAGAFAQLVVPLDSKLSARAGVRRDRSTFTVIDHLLADGDASASRVMQATSGNAGISYRPSSQLTLWTDIATVFETPTTTELANRPDGSGGFNPDLNPQRSVTEEVGARGSRGHLAIDAAVYHTNTRDAIVPYNEVAGRTYYRNAGSTRTNGFELAASYRIARNVSVLATWTLTHATFGSYRIPGTTSTDTLDGHRLAGLPEHVIHIGIRGSLGHGFTFDVDQAFASSMFGDDDNTIRIDDWGAGVTGARVAWNGRSGALSIAPFLAALNIFDRNYVGSVTTNGAGGRVFEPAAGRAVNFGLSVTAASRK